MLFTYSGMEQNVHTKTSKYGVRESTSSMGVLQERSLVVDHIENILWYMQIQQELLSTGNHTNIF